MPWASAPAERRYVVTKAPGVGGDPIPEDEPCLVIRGQDVLALFMLRTYIEVYQLYRPHDREIVTELEIHLEDLILWQEEHPGQVKWPDR